LTEATRRRLTDVRRALPRLHKVPPDDGRADYERVYVAHREVMRILIYITAVRRLVIRFKCVFVMSPCRPTVIPGGVVYA